MSLYWLLLAPLFPALYLVIISFRMAQRLKLIETNRQFFLSLPFGTVIWELQKDNDFHILDLNGKALHNALLGSVEIKAGDKLADIWRRFEASQSDIVLAEARMRGVLIDGRPDQVERIWGNNHWVSYIYKLSETAVADTFIDATQERVLNDQLMRSNRDLEQFAFIASHDLKEPLRLISNFVDVLLEAIEKYPEDENIITARNFIRKGVQRSTDLIDDLLRFSRGGRDIQKKNTLLSTIMDSVIDRMTLVLDEAGASIDLIDDVPLFCDSKMLTYVIQNIISNSLKFSVSDVPPKIEITALAKPTGSEITISDNGIGFDPLFADKIFEVFSRLHTQEEYPGTGIGLALVRRVIYAHGGNVFARSLGPGKGAQIHLYLPNK